MDGSSQAELENAQDPWSLVTVILMGIAFTLMIIIFVVGFIARIGRRRRNPRYVRPCTSVINDKQYG